MIRHIILFISSTFDQRDYERFGIRLMQNNGFKVTVWNCFPFLYPKAYEVLQTTIQIAQNCDYVELKTKPAIEDAISHLPPDAYVFFMFHPNIETMPIYKLFSKTTRDYGISYTDTFPAPLQLHPTYLWTKITTFTPQTIWSALCRRNPFLHRRVRPAAMVLAGGMKSIDMVALRKRGTQVVWAHSMDYDKYLMERDRPFVNQDGVGVFLDSDMPNHPDYLFLNSRPVTTAQEYYPVMRHFFDTLETRHHIKIIIAGHPRGKYTPSDDRFGNRPIIQGRTAELVRTSQFILTHHSTAVGFAVLFKKPLIFITTNKIEAFTENLYALALCRLLCKKQINVERHFDLDWPNEMTVNEQAYAAYKEAYLKKSGSPDKPLWQIFCDYLKQL